MKRVFTVSAVVILAAAFFGCADVPEEAPEYDAQGRRLVKFSVPTRAYENNIGGIRALSNTLAQSAWDYIEVVFKNEEGDDEYYVGSGVKGNDIHFSLPEGKYKAVMFVGVASGTKLLAVGVPTGVNGSGTPPAGDGSIEIEADTTRLTFALRALTTDILTTDIKDGDLTLDGKSAPTPATLTFKIPTGTSPDTAYAVDSENPPYFTITGNADEIEGTFKIGGFNGGDPVVGAPDDADLFNATGLFGVLDSVDSTKIIQAIGLTGYDAVTKTVITPVDVRGKVKTIGIKDGVLEIGFELATNVSTLTEGFSKIWFDVPIQAFNDSGAPEDRRGNVWHIVNGLEATYDRGDDSMGRNILLYAQIPRKYYVSTTATDDNGDGKTPETAFQLLKTAVDAAMGNAYCEEIVVLSTETAKELTASEPITITGGVNKNVITIRGSLGTETVSIASSGGTLITVGSDAKITLKKITLAGKDDNNASLVKVETGGTLVLENGAVIRGNTVSSGGTSGVEVDGGAFTMNGGNITGNTITSGGASGAVTVSSGTFTMHGGTISQNTGSYGVYITGANSTFTMQSTATIGNPSTTTASVGVYVTDSALFAMKGGTITNHEATNGGGVNVDGGTFNMSDGTINGNTATTNGGGVYVTSGAFTMSGGTISKNKATTNGGGVYVASGTFTKTKGTIYGDGDLLANTATNGHAVYVVTDTKKRNTTAGPNILLPGDGSNWE
jgi:hypothetical protein